MTNANQSSNQTNKTAGAARTRSSSVPVSENQTQDPALAGAEQEGEHEMKTENTSGVWQMIKTGFAFAFGGSIGWRFGNFVADQFGKLWRVVVLASAGWGSTYCVAQQVPDAPHHAPAAQHQQR
jgi:hypothetical protein